MRLGYSIMLTGAIGFFLFLVLDASTDTPQADQVCSAAMLVFAGIGAIGFLVLLIGAAIPGRK